MKCTIVKEQNNDYQNNTFYVFNHFAHNKITPLIRRQQRKIAPNVIFDAENIPFLLKNPWSYLFFDYQSMRMVEKKENLHYFFENS